jgi:hypothetical protein
MTSEDPSSQLTSAKPRGLRSEPLARKGETLKVLAKRCGGAPPRLLQALERRLVGFSSPVGVHDDTWLLA